ncbi:MAG: hypothetical protein Unbinned8472contig1000_15 [Prokaryotic dsDNA virus sp.]|nr:MAG: hypothetical protein Unbinned8472contig1000_15 [Prokaryotic dsDNA virus sp.]|tara:strand:+ start:9989 stop:10192 length:204 start_codon:yes stop_codon:yes gene_type:complete
MQTEKRTVHNPWTKEQFIERIVIPLKNGTPIRDICEANNIGRARFYNVLKIFGFKNKKEVINSITYK